MNNAGVSHLECYASVLQTLIAKPANAIEISVETGVTEQTVRRWLRMLMSYGMVKVTRPAREKGTGPGAPALIYQWAASVTELPPET